MENFENISNFIHDAIDKDLADGVYNKVQTRFPPEPNAYLHIGHAKALCINFGMKEKYNGKCNLRFDDTNPVKEDVEYMESIQEDIKWLGFEWDNLFNASDYFDKMYECAVKLIKDGKAFVKKYIEIKAVTDERICDGYYYASAFKLVKRYAENPELLEIKPEQVLEDID